MSKVLDVNDLLEAGKELLSETEFTGFETSLVMMTSYLAHRLAQEEGVIFQECSNHPGFGGLCATFKSITGDSITKSVIGNLDPSGEW